MIVKSARKEVVEFVDDITCDKCGKSLKIEVTTGTYDFYGKSLTVHGGYLSPALSDGVTYQFDVCEKCITKWWKSFKRQPRETEYM